MSARRVVVLPTPFRPSRPVTPSVGDVEGHALQDVRLAEVDVQIARPRATSQRLSDVCLLHGRVAITPRECRRPAARRGASRRSGGRARSPPRCGVRPSAPSCRSSSCTERISSTSAATCSTDNPAIGSSSRITRGSPARSIASSSRRLSPCESEPAGSRARDRDRPLERPSARSSASRRRRPPPEAERPAEPSLSGEPHVLARREAGGRHSRSGTCARARAGSAGTAGRPVTSAPSNSIGPRRRPVDPESRLNSDVLPAPFGPMMPRNSPRDLEGDIGDDSSRRRCRARGRRTRGSERGVHAVSMRLRPEV